MATRMDVDAVPEEVPGHGAALDVPAGPSAREAPKAAPAHLGGKHANART